MFEWKVEDLKLMNENCNMYLGNEKIYNCESKISREEKIEFVDRMNDDKLSYILYLIDKFNKEKDSMPKDDYGNIKTVSLKAWIKRNNTKNILFTYDLGKYSINGCERHINSKYKGDYDLCDDLVDEAFHRQLKNCEYKEKIYFSEHDEYSILKKRIEKYSDLYRGIYDFNVKTSYCSDGNIYIYDDNKNKRKITLDECKILIAQYKKLEKYIKQLSNEINIEY